MLFLGYLFVAIFICLSLFLAILAEASQSQRVARRRLAEERIDSMSKRVGQSRPTVVWRHHRINRE